MADVKTEQEPSIEEILESIRQIISEDGEDEAKPVIDTSIDFVPAAPPPVTPSNLSLTPEKKSEPPAVPLTLTPQQQPADKPFEAPLDLTDKIVPVTPVVAAPPPPPPASVSIEMMDSPMTDKDKSSLISAEAATSATDQLAKLLATNVAVEAEKTVAPGKVTLEDMTRDLMRPLIKTWLDQNLPGIVEKIVQKEVEKLSRRVSG
jgi:cell pole-organizing protein PopZ